MERKEEWEPTSPLSRPKLDAPYSMASSRERPDQQGEPAQAHLPRQKPTKRVLSDLRELQPSPPLFQQTPRFQALDRKPIHLSLEKLTFGDVFQREPLRRAEA
jgi:hypothetical protein